MGKRGIWILCVLFLAGISWTPLTARGSTGRINCRGAILVDAANGRVLYEQNADALIPPASITKVLTLYIVFEAIRQGRLDSSDLVYISQRAAGAPPTRMGLKAGRTVVLDELIKGMAVVSGNDACIAVAEHMSGSVEAFVAKMNAKARELGMTSSHFKNPNGLPAQGQVTTARDISKLSLAYLRRFPNSLNIHSMQSYTYNSSTRRNANRLLGTCYGVDGIKTGFVCASGYNLSATAKRGDVRLIAVVLGAPSPGIRARETAKLLDAGFDFIEAKTPEIRLVEDPKGGRSGRITVAKGASGPTHGVNKKKGKTQQQASVKKTSKKRLATSAGKEAPVSSGKKGKTASLAAKKVSAEPRAVKAVGASKKEGTVARARVEKSAPAVKGTAATAGAVSKRAASPGKPAENKSAKSAKSSKEAKTSEAAKTVKTSKTSTTAKTAKKENSPSKNAAAKTASKPKAGREKEKAVAGRGNGKTKGKSGQTAETPKKGGVVQKSHKDPNPSKPKSG
ncbi:MAG TPA: serine hydrolase [Syntrophobacteraceae bacterium]|nr:serine hydrolase [Syntrophobacteraceae bacterium]